MAKGKIEFYYDNSEIAEKIAYLLELDNRIAPNALKISTSCEGNKVITSLQHNNLGTFFATIDDLVFCEKLISNLMEAVK